MSDINIGQFSEALNDKMDRDAHNVQSPSAVVIETQTPNSSNNYTWYRKWSDGWVEQGARYETNSNIENITFPVAFAAVPTIITTSSSTTRTSYQDYQIDVYNLTTTGFTKQYIRTVGTGWGWCAFGMAA